MKKTTITVTAISALVLVALILYFNPLQKETQIIVNNFDECVAAGNPVMESHPRQCSTPDGRNFIEEIDGKKYISQNSEQCETLRFTCEQGREPFFDETGCGCKTTNLEDYFAEQIWKVGTEHLGAMPVEGFDPELYRGAFPLLEDYDFHDTEAYGGIWKYQNDKLIFERDESEPITSADGTLTNEGVKQLYNNLKIRMDFKLESNEDIDSFLEFLSGNSEEKIYCTQESRKAQACTADYNPVCGYVQVECITAPCNPVPETFSNSCAACMNERVEYYTEGACSEIN